MVKKIKEKHSPKESPSFHEIRSAQLKKYSLILMLILTLSMIAFGVYLYMTTSYQQYQIVQKNQTSSSDELMRKMKQMLDEEKARQVTLPPTPTPETNMSTVVGLLMYSLGINRSYQLDSGKKLIRPVRKERVVEKVTIPNMNNTMNTPNREYIQTKQNNGTVLEPLVKDKKKGVSGLWNKLSEWF